MTPADARSAGVPQAGACDTCLRRSHIIAALAARIEGLLQRPNERIGHLLALPTDRLIEALVPAERTPEVAEEIAALDPAASRAQAAPAVLGALPPHAL